MSRRTQVLITWGGKSEAEPSDAAGNRRQTSLTYDAKPVGAAWLLEPELPVGVRCEDQGG